MIKRILEEYPEAKFLKADGFDDCIIGVCEDSWRLIYSYKKMIDNLMKQGMSDEETIEFLSYNVIGAYMGEKTPIWCYDNF